MTEHALEPKADQSAKEIPQDVLRAIAKQVDDAVAGYETDPATPSDVTAGIDIAGDTSGSQEFYRDTLNDIGVSTYSLLRWLNVTTNPTRVLYPGSGSDQVPKLAFGEEKVIHTSLEEYELLDKKKYFDDFGEGKKVIADSERLPFEDGSFQAVCVLDSQDEIIMVYKELDRVLGYGGSIVILTNALDFDADRLTHYRERFKGYEEVAVPPELQEQGESMSQFFIFRKTV